MAGVRIFWFNHQKSPAKGLFGKTKISMKRTNKQYHYIPNGRVVKLTNDVTVSNNHLNYVLNYKSRGTTYFQNLEDLIEALLELRLHDAVFSATVDEKSLQTLSDSLVATKKQLNKDVLALKGALK